jgi:hypothetical protein
LSSTKEQYSKADKFYKEYKQNPNSEEISKFKGFKKYLRNNEKIKSS